MEILGEIVENATDMTIGEFSQKYLFEPLGIKSFDWWLTFRTGEIKKMVTASPFFIVRKIYLYNCYSAIYNVNELNKYLSILF